MNAHSKQGKKKHAQKYMDAARAMAQEKEEN